MAILRTPEARLRDLPGYPFEPHFTDVAPGLRMHHVDEGPRDGEPVLWGGHFVQEDRGEYLAERIIAWIRRLREGGSNSATSRTSSSA
jgi:hypothetical protein